jgi:predicted RNA binding protein YcfA (HicA-like mRNA interferase family)
MTEKLPRITAAEAIKALEKAGFFLARQSGAYKIYKNKEGKRVTVSYHVRKILHPKVLKSILRDADLTIEEFKKLMRQLLPRPHRPF